MTPEQWRRVNDLYHAALDLPLERRSGFVLEKTSDDGTVAQELKRLLEIDPDRTAAVDRAAVPAGHFTQFLGAPILLAGDRIADRYRIERELGAGGMGQVYEAFDEELNTRIAVKIIRPELAGEAKVVARFKQEVQLARQVTHPNVCRAYDLVRAKHRDRDLLFLCMEYVEGETLSAKLRRDGQMTLHQAEPIITQIAAGLQAAHTAGIVHRDLKCGNVFLSHDRDGELRVVLADFGLAGNLVREEGATQQTSTGWGIGTPAYMAPEQVEGGKIGPPADLYAFGIVMYEMATGHVPYEGQTPLQVAVRRLREKPRPPRELAASVDAKWESAILRCLEIDPADRFSAASDIPAALRQGRFIMPRAPRRQWRRRAGAVAAMLVLAAGAGVYWGRSREISVPVEARAAYDRGMSALYEGNWPAAENAFTRVIQAAPEFGIAYSRRAEAQMEMERIDDARSSLLRGVAASGSMTEEQKLYSQAMLAFLNTESKKAVELLTERLKVAGGEKAPNEIRLDYARLLARSGKWPDAVKPYEEVTRRDPDNAMAWIQLARAYAGGSKDADSNRAFERAAKALQTFPNPGIEKDFAYYRALVSNWRRRPDALERVQAAVKLAAQPVDFRNLRARFLLAEQLFRRGQLAEGQAEIQSAQADATQQNLDLLLAQSFYVLGNELYAQSKLEESSKVLERAIKLAEKLGAARTLAQSRLLLATNRLSRGTAAGIADARSLLDAVATGDGTEMLDSRIKALRALMLLATRQGDTERTVVLRNRLMAEAKSHSDVGYLILAHRSSLPIAVSGLQFRQALHDASECVRLAQETGEKSTVAFGLAETAWVIFLQGHYDRALDILDKVLAQPVEARTRMFAERIKASVLSEMGRAEEALRLVRKAEAEALALQQSGLAEDARASRCIVESEWKRYDLAAKTCGSFLVGPESINTGIARRSLAQAAYWGKNYSLASELAQITYTESIRNGNRMNRWSSLLTLTAAKDKLSQPVSGLQQDIDHFIRQLEQDNDGEDVVSFLRRRPFREFLREIRNSLPRGSRLEKTQTKH